MISVAPSHRDTRRDHENLGNIHQVPKKFRPIPTTWRESCISEDSVISPDKFATLKNQRISACAYKFVTPGGATRSTDG